MNASTELPRARSGSLEPGLQGALAPDLQKALEGLPPRVLHTAAATQDALRAVICEVSRGPQLWMTTGKSVVLSGSFSEEDLAEAVRAMSPWEDGISGVDGELHFRMLLQSRSVTRGIVVYLHRHRKPDVSQLLHGLKEAVARGRAALVVLGKPEAQENALRELASLASASLGLSTVLVDPQGRIGGRGRAPHRSIGAAAWVPTRTQQEALTAIENLLTHARPRVLLTAVDSASELQSVLAMGGGCLLVAALPAQDLHGAPAELAGLSSRWPTAALVARDDGSIEPVPDLRRALATMRDRQNR